MAIDEAFLKSCGIEDADTIGKITSAYSADIASAGAGLEDYKKLLEEANSTIKSFEGMDIDGIRKTADDYKQKLEEAEKRHIEFVYDTKITAYVKGLGLADDVYENYMASTLKGKGLQFDGDTLIGAGDVVEGFRKTHPNAFSPANRTPFTGQVHGINVSTEQEKRKSRIDSILDSIGLSNKK